MKLGLGLGLGLTAVGQQLQDSVLAEDSAGNFYYHADDLLGATGSWDGRIAGTGTATLGSTTGAEASDPSLSAGWLSFISANSERVNLPTTARPTIIGGTSELTVAMFIRPTDAAQAFKRLWSVEDTANTNGLLATGANGLVIFGRISDGTNFVTSTKTGLVEGRATLIALRLSTTGLSVYADNVGASTETPIGSVGTASPVSATPSLFYSAVSGPATGDLRAFRQWPRLVTVEELDAVAVELGAGS
jgi:hypothetical protein